MKKLCAGLVLMAVIAAVAVAGGQGEQGAGEDQLRVVLYVNGTLGDKSFFDSAARGLEMAEEELGVFGRVV